MNYKFQAAIASLKLALIKACGGDGGAPKPEMELTNEYSNLTPYQVVILDENIIKERVPLKGYLHPSAEVGDILSLLTKEKELGLFFTTYWVVTMVGLRDVQVRRVKQSSRNLIPAIAGKIYSGSGLSLKELILEAEVSEIPRSPNKPFLEKSSEEREARIRSGGFK